MTHGVTRVALPPAVRSFGWAPDGGISTDEILGVTVTDIRYRKRLSP